MDIDKNGCYAQLLASVKMFGSEERDNWQCIMHLHLLQNPHLRDECFNLTSSFTLSDCTGSSIGDEARCKNKGPIAENWEVALDNLEKMLAHITPAAIYMRRIYQIMQDNPDFQRYFQLEMRLVQHAVVAKGHVYVLLGIILQVDGERILLLRQIRSNLLAQVSIENLVGKNDLNLLSYLSLTLEIPLGKIIVDYVATDSDMNNLVKYLCHSSTASDKIKYDNFSRMFFRTATNWGMLRPISVETRSSGTQTRRIKKLVPNVLNFALFAKVPLRVGLKTSKGTAAQNFMICTVKPRDGVPESLHSDTNQQVFRNINRSTDQIIINQYEVLLRNSPLSFPRPLDVLNIVDRFDYSPPSRHGDDRNSRSVKLHFLSKNMSSSGVSSNAWIGKALSNPSGEINPAKNILEILLEKKQVQDGYTSVPASYLGSNVHVAASSNHSRKNVDPPLPLGNESDDMMNTHAPPLDDPKDTHTHPRSWFFSSKAEPAEILCLSLIQDRDAFFQIVKWKSGQRMLLLQKVSRNGDINSHGFTVFEAVRDLNGKWKYKCDCVLADSMNDTYQCPHKIVYDLTVNAYDTLVGSTSDSCRVTNSSDDDDDDTSSDDDDEDDTGSNKDNDCPDDKISLVLKERIATYLAHSTPGATDTVVYVDVFRRTLNFVVVDNIHSGGAISFSNVARVSIQCTVNGCVTIGCHAGLCGTTRVKSFDADKTYDFPSFLSSDTGCMHVQQLKQALRSAPKNSSLDGAFSLIQDYCSFVNGSVCDDTTIDREAEQLLLLKQGQPLRPSQLLFDEVLQTFSSCNESPFGKMYAFSAKKELLYQMLLHTSRFFDSPKFVIDELSKKSPEDQNRILPEYPDSVKLMKFRQDYVITIISMCCLQWGRDECQEDTFNCDYLGKRAPGKPFRGPIITPNVPDSIPKCGSVWVLILHSDLTIYYVQAGFVVQQEVYYYRCSGPNACNACVVLADMYRLGIWVHSSYVAFQISWFYSCLNKLVWHKTAVSFSEMYATAYAHMYTTCMFQRRLPVISVFIHAFFSFYVSMNLDFYNQKCYIEDHGASGGECSSLIVDVTNSHINLSVPGVDIPRVEKPDIVVTLTEEQLHTFQSLLEHYSSTDNLLSEIDAWLSVVAAGDLITSGTTSVVITASNTSTTRVSVDTGGGDVAAVGLPYIGATSGTSNVKTGSSTTTTTPVTAGTTTSTTSSDIFSISFGGDGDGSGAGAGTAADAKYQTLAHPSIVPLSNGPWERFCFYYVQPVGTMPAARLVLRALFANVLKLAKRVAQASKLQKDCKLQIDCIVCSPPDSSKHGKKRRCNNDNDNVDSTTTCIRDGAAIYYHDVCLESVQAAKNAFQHIPAMMGMVDYLLNLVTTDSLYNPIILHLSKLLFQLSSENSVDLFFPLSLLPVSLKYWHQEHQEHQDGHGTEATIKYLSMVPKFNALFGDLFNSFITCDLDGVLVQFFPHVAVVQCMKYLTRRGAQYVFAWKKFAAIMSHTLVCPLTSEPANPLKTGTFALNGRGGRQLNSFITVLPLPSTKTKRVPPDGAPVMDSQFEALLVLAHQHNAEKSKKYTLQGMPSYRDKTLKGSAGLVFGTCCSRRSGDPLFIRLFGIIFNSESIVGICAFLIKYLLELPCIIFYDNMCALCEWLRNHGYGEVAIRIRAWHDQFHHSKAHFSCASSTNFAETNRSSMRSGKADQATSGCESLNSESKVLSAMLSSLSWSRSVFLLMLWVYCKNSVRRVRYLLQSIPDAGSQ